MINPQFAPLEVNPQTGEPFLRLRKHKKIIITPPRADDIQFYIALLNDPKIYNGLQSIPIPYLPEQAEVWYEKVKKLSDEALQELEAARGSLVQKCPIRAIREIQADGKDIYIGDIGIGRVYDARLLVLPNRNATEEELQAALKANNDAPIGDPNILYTIGDYLAPSHHGQGIMTDVLETLLWDWGVPRMGVCKVRASAFEGNVGSVRVFEKNGFTLTQTLDGYAEARGEWHNMHVLEWDKDGSGVSY